MTLRNLPRGAAVVALALGLSAPATAAPAAAAAAPAPAFAAADWKRLDPDNLLVIDTTKGRIVVELRPEMAPEHVQRIKEVANQGFYDGLKFFRVIDAFMAQTGDKANTGAGDSGMAPLKGTFSFRRGPETPIAAARNPRGGSFGFVGSMAVASQPDELMGLTADGKVKSWGLFCQGVAGMARTQDPDSASTQFFLMRQASTALDENYTPWGRVVAGLDVVRALTVGEPPVNPDTMTRVRVASALPAAERPDVWRVDTTGAAFQARVAATVAAKGAAFTPCDVEAPSEIRK